MRMRVRVLPRPVEPRRLVLAQHGRPNGGRRVVLPRALALEPRARLLLRALGRRRAVRERVRAFGRDGRRRHGGRPGRLVRLVARLSRRRRALCCPRPAGRGEYGIEGIGGISGSLMLSFETPSTSAAVDREGREAAGIHAPRPVNSRRSSSFFRVTFNRGDDR
ncbi:hypothetical protein NUW54_g9657 [Trametes sanguinea]|uniref:Uncharacterized protein n=1 Tax=Trametes sanguinea TaxID=158606 RepID=A0ACC1P7C2_9APHY|nr:hypothetical protein NUW54_g9657 [Trametes sanguinea]